MKLTPMLTCIVFVMAAFPSISFAEPQPDPSKSIKSEILTIQMSPSKLRFQTNEPLEFQVVITNNGKKPLHLWNTILSKSFADGKTFNQGGAFKLVHLKTGKEWQLGCGSEITRAAPRSWPITLAVGESHTETFSCRHFLGWFPIKEKFVPGEYQLHSTFHFTEKQKAAEPCWTGSCEATAIKFIFD